MSKSQGPRPLAFINPSELFYRTPLLLRRLLTGLHRWLRADKNQQKGEFVILVHGSILEDSNKMGSEAQRILGILMTALPIKQAAALAAEITGLKKNALYDYALRLKEYRQD